MPTILLIEDHDTVRENLAEMLELAGYRVVQAADGVAGVELARAARPDLIICDILMPELDGYGVLHILHQDPGTTDIPFIFLTVKAGREDVERGMSAGADDYLTKPFDNAVLLAAVAMRLGKHHPPALPGGAAGTGIPALHEQLAAGPRQYKKKYVLFLEGDVPHSLYWLRQGAAKTYKTDAAGNELITELSHDGHFLGYRDLLAATAYTVSTELLADATIEILPQQQFFALLEQHPDVARHFLRLLALDSAADEARELELAYQPVRHRLALALLRFEQAFAPLGYLDHGTSMSRENLAALVGASKETVSRMLGDFRARGLIAITGPHITILSPDRLRRLQP